MTDTKLYDVESEHAVIGSIILQPGAIELIWGHLQPGDFFDERNRKMFRACMDLYAKCSAIDTITLQAHLNQENGQGEDWSLHLSGMLSGMPNCLHIESYAAKVAELADKRRLLSCSQNLTTAIIENNSIETAKADLQAAAERTRRGGADPWKSHIFTLRDTLQPLTPARQVVAGLIDRPSVNCVYSPPGCHKTNYCIDVSICVAAGITHLAPLPNVRSSVRSFETAPCPVMLLDFDNGRRRLHERVGAFARGHGVREDAPIFCTSMPSPWLVASDPASMDALAERVTRYKIGLLIVDNLLVTSGAANENDPEMAPIMAAWRRLSEWCNLATILIHHPNKRENVIRPGDRLRGHGSIEAALDLALFVEREETSGNITVKATKVRGSDVLPYGALFTYEHRSGSTELESARFYGVEVDDSGSDRSIRETILQVVTESPRLNKTVLKEQVHKLLPAAGLNRIGSQVELLASKRQIKHEEGTRGARLYVIASKQSSFTDSQSLTEGS